MVKRARMAELRLANAERDLVVERERNRKREEDLLDRVLIRHNSRPVSPAEPVIPLQAQPTNIDIARLQDMVAEEMEHHGRPLTPHELHEVEIRSQLDDLLAQEASRPLVIR